MTTAHQYNNPFDISLKPSQLGAYPGAYIQPIQGQPQFVAFPTYAMGVQAFQDRLDRAFSGGNPSGSIAELNTWYARDQNWQNNVSSASGIGVNDALDPNNVDQKNALAYGIVSAEHGRGTADEIFGGPPGSSNFNNVLWSNSSSDTASNMLPMSGGSTDFASGSDTGIDPATGDFVPGATTDQVNAYAQSQGYSYPSEDTAGGASYQPGPDTGSNAGYVPATGDQATQLDTVDAGPSNSPMPGPVGQAGIGGAGPGNFGLSGPLGQAGKTIAGGLSGSQSGFGIEGAAAGGGGGAAQAGDSGSGFPITITDATKVGQQAGSDVKTGAEDLTKGLGQDTQAITKQTQASTTQATSELTGVTQYAGNLVYDTLPRVIGFVIAAILIGMALWMTGKRSEAGG